MGVLEKKEGNVAPGNNVVYLQPTVKETRLLNNHYVSFALLPLLLGVLFQIIAMRFFKMDVISSMVLAFVLVVIYAIFLFFLLEPKLLKEIHQPIVQTIDKPVYQEVIRTVEVEKPVIQEVVRTVEVEKPVEVIRTVEKPVYQEVEKKVPVYFDRVVRKYITRKPKKLNIPHYDFVGSSLTMKYHKTSCRLGKSIKKKYKLHDNHESFFKKKKYSPCQVCILKTTKV